MDTKNSSFENAENPWLNIDWNNRFAVDDECVIRNFNRKKRNKERMIDTDMLPEPFTGNINSRVVFLGLNPGASDINFLNSSALLNETRATLNHSSHNSMWLSGNLENCIEGSHLGCCWWKRRTKKLCDDLGITPDKLNVFVLEFFPYHSKCAVNFPQLKSDKYRNKLLYNAIKAGKLIVIMRSAEKWFSIQDSVDDGTTLGCLLKNYHNLLVLSSPQNVSLSPNNIKNPNTNSKDRCWQKLLDALRD